MAVDRDVEFLGPATGDELVRREVEDCRVVFDDGVSLVHRVS